MSIIPVNLSTEFRNNELNDPICYKVNIRELIDSKDIPEKYKNKERKLKEVPNVGGFKIPKNQLKKRINPSDEYDKEIADKRKKISTQKHKLNEMNINMEQHNNSPPIKFCLSKEEEELLKNPESIELSGNIVDIIDKQVQLLKWESENELKKESSLKYENSTNSFDYNKSNYSFNNNSNVNNNINNNLLISNFNKNDSNSLNKKNEVPVNSINIRNKKEDLKLKAISSLFNDLISVDEINAILRHEKQLQNFKKQNTVKSKSICKNKEIDNNYNNYCTLNKTQKDYVDRLAKYRLKQKILLNKKNNNKNKEWNTTRIHSKNIHGKISNNNDLPGFFGNDDYSLYYNEITKDNKNDIGKFKAPHWDSVPFENKYIDYGITSSITKLKVNNKDINSSPNNEHGIFKDSQPCFCE